MNWYALEVSTSKTFDVRNDLKRARYETCVPWEFAWKRDRNRKRIKVPTPLMPGYVFAQLPADVSWSAILEIDYVHRPVAFGGPPLAIPERTMRRIQNLTRQEIEELSHMGKALKPGVRAEIVDGPLAGNEVHVKSIRGDRAKVVFKMIFASMVEVSTDSLEVA